MTIDGARDATRRAIAARGLTPTAAAHLARDAFARIDLDKLAPVKGFLKQFFSDAEWTAADDDAFAALVGPGEGWWRHDLGDGLELQYGWRDGTFRIDVAGLAGADAGVPARSAGSASLADSFAGAVVPEATPNPRTIRFVTGPVHEGPSRWYDSAEGVDDERVAGLFTAFPDIDNVLVGPDFVAVGLRRPDRWETLLAEVLRAIEAEFTLERSASVSLGSESDSAVSTPVGSSVSPARTGPEHERALDRAWRALGSLNGSDPDAFSRIVAAAASSDVAERQVAARVLIDVEPEVAGGVWRQLLGDSSRLVRRAVVDAMVDAQRPALRPLLEVALADTDSWVRWKALRGLVELGVEPSRAVVATLTDDPDFRVRLEATGALRI